MAWPPALCTATSAAVLLLPTKMQEERLQGAVAGDKGARACVSALLLDPVCSGLGGLQELLVG